MLPSSPDRSRVLVVDDEPLVLKAHSRYLQREYEVLAAPSAHEAMELLDAWTPIAVVVSDLRMPGEDGIRLLQSVARVAPDTSRVLLSAHVDLDAAMRAVSEGQVYQILTKPCNPAQLRTVVAQAAERHQLIRAERELLERTLTGSISALVDALSITNPRAFGHSKRICRMVGEVLDSLEISQRWEIEVAAMVSHLGTVTLPETLVERLWAGKRLSGDELRQVSEAQALSERILGHIPRLEGVRNILRYQLQRYDGNGVPLDGVRGTALPLGARVLKAVIACDRLESWGLERADAVSNLREDRGGHDPRVLEALAPRRRGVAASKVVFVNRLTEAMVLDEHVYSKDGLLLAQRGTPLGTSLIERLRNFAVTRGVREPFRVLSVGAES